MVFGLLCLSLKLKPHPRYLLGAAGRDLWLRQTLKTYDITAWKSAWSHNHLSAISRRRGKQRSVLINEGFANSQKNAHSLLPSIVSMQRLHK